MENLITHISIGTLFGVFGGFIVSLVVVLLYYQFSKAGKTDFKSLLSPILSLIAGAISVFFSTYKLADLEPYLPGNLVTISAFAVGFILAILGLLGGGLLVTLKRVKPPERDLWFDVKPPSAKAR
jgi:hypothetical protein